MWRVVIFVLSVAVLYVSQGQIPPGGRHPVSPDDPRVVAAVEYAAADINAVCNSKYCQTLLNVTNTQEQVVDGSVFYFSVNMQKSEECLSSECMGSIPDNKCPPSQEAKPYWCDVVVIVKSWSEPTHLVRNLTCQNPSN